jgi:hypothetical protein
MEAAHLFSTIVLDHLKREVVLPGHTYCAKNVDADDAQKAGEKVMTMTKKTPRNSITCNNWRVAAFSRTGYKIATITYRLKRLSLQQRKMGSADRSTSLDPDQNNC